MKWAVTFVLGLAFVATKAQFYLDVSGMASNPVPDVFGLTPDFYNLPGGPVPGENFFVENAGLAWGGGIGFRYFQSRTTVGINLSYGEFAQVNPDLRITMFRSLITAEYLLLDPEKFEFQWYVGGETGIYQPKYYFDPRIGGTLPVSKSFFGIGVRSGISIPVYKRVRIYAELCYAISELSTFNAKAGLLIPLRIQ
jgi:hypothetical protein